jgi:hypothetical protein
MADEILAHRVEDKRIQRMVKHFLEAGVAEDGSVTVSDERTPQCAFHRCWQTRMAT